MKISKYILLLFCEIYVGVGSIMLNIVVFQTGGSGFDSRNLKAIIDVSSVYEEKRPMNILTVITK